MRDDAQQRQAIEPLVLQEERRVAFLFLQDEDEQASGVDMLRARHRRVNDRLLNHAIEGDGRLRFDRRGRGDRRERLGEHFVHLLAQRIEVDAACRKQRACLRLVGDRAQQVLEADGVVPAIGGEPERPLDRLERLGRERDWGFTH